MKINTLKIKNFKCFEHVELEFDESFNVLIGDNASGKTSILDAASFTLGTFFIGARKATNDSRIELRPLKFTEKRRELTDTAINYKLPFSISADVSISNTSHFLTRGTDKVSGGSTTYKEATSFIDEAQALCKGMFDSEDTTDLPLIAYYGTERLFNERSQRNANSRRTARTDGYDCALDPRSLEERFISWFSQEEDEVLKFGKDKALYTAFTNAITTMVPDWKELRFSWPHESVLGLMDSGEWISFDMLSSGYKSIVRLAGDIAYRAIKLNPHRGINAVTETAGVVLIDEIDMHLHPAWQKKIISLMKSAFPNIQFIVTTHSPFVIQSAQHSELIKLDQSRVEQVSDNVNMKSLEEVAEDEMDLENVRRSEKYQDYMNLSEEYFRLLGSNNESSPEFSATKCRLDEIEIEFIDDPAIASLLKIEREASKDK